MFFTGTSVKSFTKTCPFGASWISRSWFSKDGTSTFALALHGLDGLLGVVDELDQSVDAARE